MNSTSSSSSGRVGFTDLLTGAVRTGERMTLSPYCAPWVDALGGYPIAPPCGLCDGHGCTCECHGDAAGEP